MSGSYLPLLSPAYDQSAKLQHVVGVPNSSGNWLSGMLMFVSKQVAGTHLTPMSIAEIPPDTQDEVQRGKQRQGEDEHVGLRMPVSAVSVSRCHNQNRKNGEGDMRSIHAPSAPALTSQCPGALSPTPGAPQLHLRKILRRPLSMPLPLSGLRRYRPCLRFLAQ